MSESQENSTAGFSTTTTVLVWIAALGLASLLFEDVLNEQFNHNSQPQSRLLNGEATVVLKRNRYGHYVTTGHINGQEVVFMVDTGATNVSVPADIARELGLEKGPSGRSQTANGTVTVYQTVIPELRIGAIRLYDVVGSINPGMEGPDILLGMSALKQLEFSQRGDTLTLKTL